MTFKEKLLVEFECAIIAVYGDKAFEDSTKVEINNNDLKLIHDKVKFYLDLK